MDILKNSDIFILPSENESFGLAVLEAMACGLPCITSDAGGLPEINLDGLTGFIVPVGQIELYIHYISLLRKDENLYHQLATNARQHAFQNYHPGKITPLYLEFYQKVLEQRSVSNG